MFVNQYNKDWDEWVLSTSLLGSLKYFQELCANMFLHHHLLRYKTRHVGYAQKNVQLVITCMNFNYFFCLLEENNCIFHLSWQL